MSCFASHPGVPSTRWPNQADEHLLDAVVGEIAHADNIPKPKFAIMEGGIYEYGPMAQRLENGGLGVNRSMLKTLECTDKAVSGEMRAVLAHEMHHIGNAGKQYTALFLPVVLFPAAAMAGYHFWRKAHEGAKDNAQFHSNLDAIVAQHKGVLLPHPNPSTENNFLTAAKYAAVGMAGVGASLVSARYFSRAFEYAADLHGAKHTSPEVMASAIRKVCGTIEEGIAKGAKPPLWNRFMDATFMAHPSTAERIAKVTGR